MVAQIIVSHEDTTSFFSIGTVQDDASLVSALGGALASFAVEMGLSDIGTTNANYSKFQNGVLISKWLTVGNHKPSLMIAIRDFENLEQYHHMFLIDFGTLIAQKIISTYEKLYAGDGEVPLFENAVKFLPAIVHELYKDSPSTLKEFIEKSDEFAKELFNDIWVQQSDQGSHAFKFRSYTYDPEKIEQIKKELIEYYYQEGTHQDALFPLSFAAASDLKLVAKKVEDYLKQQAKQSRVDLADEIKRIVQQLRVMSSSRYKRGKHVESVDLINADLIFEKISLTRTGNMEKERVKILNNLFKTLLQKLYQNYPLKFLAASYTKPIDISYIKEIFEKATKPLLKELITDTSRINKQVSNIFRDVASDINPEDTTKINESVMQKILDRYVKLIRKQDPFVILADSNLLQIKEVVKKQVEESFEQYRTAHDEAMALYYITRQINRSISKLKTVNYTSLMKVHFLQQLVRTYRFRNVPRIVYDISHEIFSDFASSSISSNPVYALIQRNLASFEKEAQLTIPKDIKQTILKQFKTTSVSQRFVNIEALSFFSRAFSDALESTIVRILKHLFGNGVYPYPPKRLTSSIEKIVLTSQSIYSVSRIMEEIVKQPGCKELFERESINIITKNLKYGSILPSPVELALIAYDENWLVDKKKKKGVKSSKAQLLTKEVSIPHFDLKGKVSKLIKNPIIVLEMWVLFGLQAFKNRLTSVKDYSRELEKKTKTSAGDVSGKKKFAVKIKSTKNLMKAYNQFISGGNFLQKMFLRKKDLNQLFYDLSQEKYSGLNYFPNNFTIDSDNGLIFDKEITIKKKDMLGSFKRLAEVYASTWVKESEYVRRLNEEIIWGVIEKTSHSNLPLEKKIIENLKSEASRGGKVDQETVVRTTIDQEVSLMFKRAVREVITKPFEPIKDDLLVRIDPRTKDYYLKINTIGLNKKYLQQDYEKLDCLKLVKKTGDTTDVWMNLTDLLPMFSSRKKNTRPVRIYIRDGMKETLRGKHFKAFNGIGELIDKYIGEQAANQFYSYNRILEQLILESIDQS
ncbi:MAG: hypothetical protein ACTSPT_00075 [Candidatus Heimdallarchaeota archaeon]